MPVLMLNGPDYYIVDKILYVYANMLNVCKGLIFMRNVLLKIIFSTRDLDSRMKIKHKTS